MPCIPWRAIVPAAPRTPLPDPLNPRLWGGMTTTTVRSVAVAATVTQLCTANPERIMVGFAARTNSDLRIRPAGGTYRLVPETDATFHDYYGWFTLRTHGPLVQLAWIGECFPVSTIDVYEVLKLNR